MKHEARNVVLFCMVEHDKSISGDIANISTGEVELLRVGFNLYVRVPDNIL